MQTHSFPAVTVHTMPQPAQQQKPGSSPGVPADCHSGPASRTCVVSSDLMRGQRECTIEHNGAVYRLQVTRMGKLILTK